LKNLTFAAVFSHFQYFKTILDSFVQIYRKMRTKIVNEILTAASAKHKKPVFKWLKIYEIIRERLKLKIILETRKKSVPIKMEW
jgi:hypothetical protein